MSPAPVPGPVVTLISLMFATALVFNIVYDAITAAYSGERVTFFLGVVVFAMLGYDVTKLYRKDNDRG